MTVKVTDLEHSLTLEKEFDHVIGLLDHAEKFTKLALRFQSEPKRSMFWFDDTIDGRWAPTEKDAEEIINTIREKDLHNIQKKVLVHCFAGISRSTATAICLLIMRDWTIESAFNQIHIQRPRMWPNDALIRHFDNLLKLEGRLIAHEQEWKKIHMHDRFPGFND